MSEISDAQCAEIVRSVEDYFETQELDYDPNTAWIGGSWRFGRSSLHTARIAAKAEQVLPEWVCARAAHYYEAQG